MAHSRIISIENPTPLQGADCICVDYRHSKWVIRRRYVESILLPQTRRMGFESAETFNAITEPDYESSRTLDASGNVASVSWMGDSFNIVSGGTSCLLSHVTLWKMCIEKGIALMIFEDDARLDSANESLVSAAISEYEKGPYNNDVLYLQLAVPYLPTAIKSYHKKYTKTINKNLIRVIKTGDMAGSAAYAVRPGSAQALLNRAIAHGTNGADAIMHHALDSGEIGVLVMTDYQRGYMLDDHWSEWNHIHDPEVK